MCVLCASAFSLARGQGGHTGTHMHSLILLKTRITAYIVVLVLTDSSLPPSPVTRHSANITKTPTGFTVSPLNISPPTPECVGRYLTLSKILPRVIFYWTYYLRFITSVLLLQILSLSECSQQIIPYTWHMMIPHEGQLAYSRSYI